MHNPQKPTIYGSAKSFLCFSFILLMGQGVFSEEAIITQEVEIDFGEDRGQSFGNLFEFVNAEGTVVGGAGFVAVYNTRFRNDR